ncbi:hydroxyacyl-thioester dehydratase type 2, mitochondrial-like [Centruroides sculpturatus]|uniref:hydroxyacyl-thioester dehydratase type 2, mitochondrial-like n=1 Tax=Centruroides sculpturatus TaxID=218467 RepID=UPI000C6DBE21|nr:hydroxyacyl-thioester dehydratase type 2, mitochondrial-like [Centruroides sculpturatus]
MAACLFAACSVRVAKKWLHATTLSLSGNSHIHEGDTAEETRLFTKDDVELFSKLTGDFNPIHLNDSYAQKQKFDGRLVHGALINGLISCLLGTKLPGPGCVVVKELLEFPAPLYVDEKVVAKVVITSVRKTIVKCSFNCCTENGKEVLKGEAKLLLK